MNTEFQEIETFQIFVVPMGNTKITEELDLKTRNYSVTPNKKKEKARDDLDGEESIKDSESPSDNIEEAKHNLVAQSSKRDKTTKAYINI